MNELKQALAMLFGQLLVLFLMIYATAYIMGGQKMANKFARWTGKKIENLIRWILTAAVKLLKNLLKSVWKTIREA